MQAAFRRLPLAATAVFALAMAVSRVADAEFSASATVESEYRFRGVALTDDKPDARIELSYDHPSGAYAGFSLIGGETVHDSFQGLGYIAYLGFAQKATSTVSWDFGVTISEINLYLRPNIYSAARPQQYMTPQYPESQPSGVIRYRADYSEAYFGVSWRETSAYLYVSPNYLGQSLRTAYLDVTQNFRPIPHVRFYGHVGVLTPLDGSALPGDNREHYDFGLGCVYEFRHAEIGLAWSGMSPQVQYPAGYPQKRNVAIASITGFF